MVGAYKVWWRRLWVPRSLTDPSTAPPSLALIRLRARSLPLYHAFVIPSHQNLFNMYARTTTLLLLAVSTLGEVYFSSDDWSWTNDHSFHDLISRWVACSHRHKAGRYRRPQPQCWMYRTRGLRRGQSISLSKAAASTPDSVLTSVQHSRLPAFSPLMHPRMTPAP